MLTERVLEIHHYTDKLFSFKTTRSPSFRFASGQFAMMGLLVDGKPLLRAYSITSGYYDDHLEFFSIKVPNGPLTSRLQHIGPGDEIVVNPKATGTLLLGNLNPGKRLILMATGTGFAPFASILRDPETFESFETVVLAYGCREVAELEYATQTVVALHDHELLGPMIGEKLHYYASVTREAFHRQGRITDLLTSGKLFADLKQSALNALSDRVMICGNPGMTLDLRKMLIERGFAEGNSNRSAEFVIEKAFVGG
ncbi:MAG: ferredoxin--NADP reductase [Hyphomicrobiaceae bacterium]